MSLRSRLTRRALALACATLLASAAQAHSLFLLPSSTVLSGSQWITVDAAVSNDLFYFNHQPLNIDALKVIGPDGGAVTPENVTRGKLRTTFDLNLNRNGTYKIEQVFNGVFASWKENGQPKRWRGSTEAFAREVPAGAQDLRVTESAMRLETFVTVGKPTTTVFQPTGKGLELIPVTHPNDLVSGETARFRLQLDGKPASGLEVRTVRGDTRYRDKMGEIKATTNEAGEFQVKWPEPGMYWMGISTTDKKTSVPQASGRRLNYTATFEVMPQ